MTATTTTTKDSIIEGAKDPYTVLYDWKTPNGQKVTILLELLGIDYYLRPIKLPAKEQKEDWFLKINANGKIPTLAYVEEGKPEYISESSAIMLFLADRYDTKREFSFKADSLNYYQELEWLFFQTSQLAPHKGQWHFFELSGNAPEDEFAVNRFYSETIRLLGVLDEQLKRNGTGYIVGDHLSLADISVYPWLLRTNEKFVKDLGKLTYLTAWFDKLSELPAFKKGSELPATN